MSITLLQLEEAWKKYYNSILQLREICNEAFSIRENNTRELNVIDTEFNSINFLEGIPREIAEQIESMRYATRSDGSRTSGFIRSPRLFDNKPDVKYFYLQVLERIDEAERSKEASQALIFNKMMNEDASRIEENFTIQLQTSTTYLNEAKALTKSYFTQLAQLEIEDINKFEGSFNDSKIKNVLKAVDLKVDTFISLKISEAPYFKICNISDINFFDICELSVN
jgi:hypothetical protein